MKIRNSLFHLKFSKRIFVKEGMPLYLLFFVTSRCNAKCKHCWYWKKTNDPSEELDLEEIEKISKGLDNLIFLNLAGGEPFLRQDLPEIAYIFYKNNFVRNIAVSTNGFFEEEIFNSVKKILKLCEKSYFTVNVSIDGIHNNHDKIRGVNGLFKRAINTYQKLKSLEKEHKNFCVGVSITVSSYNQRELGLIYDFVKNKMKPKNISIFLTRGNPREISARNVDIKYYERISQLLDRDIKNGRIGYANFPFSTIVNLKDLLMHKMIVNTVRNNKFLFPCFAGKLSAVIFENGDVYPCELLDKKMGNLRENNHDFKEIWTSKKAEEIRKLIKDTKCFCTHECFFNANILFNLKTYPLLIKEWVKIKTSKNKGDHK